MLSRYQRERWRLSQAVKRGQVKTVKELTKKLMAAELALRAAPKNGRT